MKPLLIAVAALAVAAAAQAAPSPTAAARTTAPKTAALEVRQAWSRPAVAGSTGVGYMTLANRGGAPQTLVAVASPWAAKVEMHASSMAGGVMRMARQDKVSVPPHGEVAFSPGSYHLMLLGLKRPLKAGDSVPATLTFASGARLDVSFAVGSGLGPPASAAGAAMGAMDHMGHMAH